MRAKTSARPRAILSGAHRSCANGAHRGPRGGQSQGAHLSLGPTESARAAAGDGRSDTQADAEGGTCSDAESRVTPILPLCAGPLCARSLFDSCLGVRGPNLPGGLADIHMRPLGAR